MRNYPEIYSQRNQQWANNELGTAPGATISMYGCLLTCHAMKAGYYNHQIAPDALNDIYKQKNLYISQDLLSDADLSAVYPDIQLITTKSYAGIPADLNYLKELSQDETLTVTIELDFDHDPNDGIQTHFVELSSYDGTTLIIYDPWYGTQDNFTLHYGTAPATTIQKIAVYKGTPVSPNVSVDSQTFQKLVTNSSSYDIVCDEVGEPHNTLGSKVVADIAKLKINLTAAQQTISTLNQQLPALQNDNKTLQNQVNSLTQELQLVKISTIEPTSKINYQTLYIQSEAKNTQLQAQLQTTQVALNTAKTQYGSTSAILIPKTQLLQTLLSRFFSGK